MSTDRPVKRVCAVCERDISHRGEGTLYCHRTCRDKAKRRRNRASTSGPLLPAPPEPQCARCGKVACPTLAAAKLAKRAVEAKTGRTNEVRYYQCEDGWWHWTRQDATLEGFRARAGAQ